MNAVGGVRNRLQWLAALLLVTLWVFVLTTGIVFSSYIVILLPFMALNIADRGYVLQQGRIVLSDAAKNLLTNDLVRRAYLGG